jgi:hypothetical protein
MWKKADIVEIVLDADHDTIISQHPDNNDENYIILYHDKQRIEAISVSGTPTLKIFHEDELISGKWWVQH